MNTTIKTHTVHGEPMHIHIRLSDPCNNGHNDWAITADIWRKGSNILSDRNIDRCGCCHEDILSKMPSLKIFVDLHLSNESGAPMYAIENGFYHMRNSSLEVFADYMRVDLMISAKVKKEITSKESFSYWVDGLRAGWLEEANRAKALLAELIEKNSVNA